MAIKEKKLAKNCKLLYLIILWFNILITYNLAFLNLLAKSLAFINKKSNSISIKYYNLALFFFIIIKYRKNFIEKIEIIFIKDKINA